MIVVVEGPDGAGKSTLIEKLRANSTRYFIIIKSAGPPPHLGYIQEFHDALEAFERSFSPMPITVICDRHPAISDPIYAGLIGDRKSIPLSTSKWMLRSIDVLIYCRPSDAVILANVHGNEQMDGVREKTRHIIAEYDDTISRLFSSGGKTRVFDYNYASAEGPTQLEHIGHVIFQGQL